MRSYPVPNLRRDVAVSVVLLIMAVAAVIPATIAVAIALAGLAGLMVFRLAVRLPIVVRRRPGTRSSDDLHGRRMACCHPA
jgi:hypothetical protein